MYVFHQSKYSTLICTSNLFKNKNTSYFLSKVSMNIITMMTNISMIEVGDVLIVHFKPC